ncbi:MAG TPA: DUF362 domain-containing protein [Thermodesulfobacteriota bacterium]|nr:DUF362 domain-containing protein [Thermodesulfobacteriota bacterium]
MENRRLDRRSFLTQTAGFIASLTGISSLPLSPAIAEERPDIAAVEGDNPAAQTRRAIQALGGMSAFVRRGDRVVILPNAEWRYPGTFVKPEIGVELVRLCTEAGAASITVTTHYGIGRWGREIAEELASAGARIKTPSHPADYVTVPVPEGKARKEVTVVREALDNDVLIDVPVFKNHYGARISGCVKNLMGFNWNSISFHQGTEYLNRAIADLAMVIRPHLCVVDATTILTENGPGGPGKTAHPRKIYAGRDMVALDAICCPLLNLKPGDVAHVMHLAAAGRGRADVSRMKVSWIKS